MIMTGLREWNKKTLKTKTKITVKNISKTKTIQKSKIMKIKTKIKV